MKKWVLYLFSYNRPDFLWNAALSIKQYLPWADCVVVDDGSDHQDMGIILNKIKDWPNWKIKVMEKKQGMYGGFYQNMAWALNDACESSYDYCYFFEDDEQFVWCPDNYPDHVDNLFAKCKDAHQIQTLFFRRIKDYSKTIKYVPEVRAYQSNRGFNTTGIWNLEVVRRENDIEFFNKGDGFPMNSANWLEKGYRLYLDEHPTVAILPWVSSNAESFLSKTVNLRAEDFLLRPLTESEIYFIENKQPSRLAYQEYFNLSNGNCLRPIWHQNNRLLNRYFQLCASTLDAENEVGESPTSIDIKNDKKVEPEPTHLNYKQQYLAGNIPSNGQAGVSKFRLFAYRHMKLLVKIWRFIQDVRQISLSSFLKYRELCGRLKNEQQAVKEFCIKRGV